MDREIPERMIKPEAKELVKKGVYSSLRQAVKALREGHTKGGKCPWTGRRFKRRHGPEHGFWITDPPQKEDPITKVRVVPFCSECRRRLDLCLL